MIRTQIVLTTFYIATIILCIAGMIHCKKMKDLFGAAVCFFMGLICVGMMTIIVNIF